MCRRKHRHELRCWWQFCYHLIKLNILATTTICLKKYLTFYSPDPIPQRQTANPFAVQRPHATQDMLVRQGSFRGFQKLSETSPFKRQLSLRLNDLPSTLERRSEEPHANGIGHNGPGNYSDRHYSDVTWASWHLQSLTTSLFVQQQRKHYISTLLALWERFPWQRSSYWGYAMSWYRHGYPRYEQGFHVRLPGPWFNIKMSSYQYRKFHCGDKTVVKSSFLHNGISYAGKMASLCWISPRNLFQYKNLFFFKVKRLPLWR